MRLKIAGPYVYALADESGRVFYIGKGRRDRMYQHQRDAARGKPGKKNDRIRSIIESGKELQHLVLGEYETDAQALAAEVLFIAAHDGLTNMNKGGGGSSTTGCYKSAIIAQAKLLKASLIGQHGTELSPYLARLLEEIERQISDPSPTMVIGHPDGRVEFKWNRHASPGLPERVRHV